MSNLFILSYGKSKKKMETIMVEEMPAINLYKQSRDAQGSFSGRMGSGWFKIEVAPKGADKWRKKSCTVGGNKCDIVPRIGKNGQTRRNGYIDKHGFHQHT